ncbi:exopolyphosphatase [Actinoplanes sp. N902-109]|uniref:Ppx/GppA phosphatase family protein n=1 Tax=Actinoplanes sp. (strain N902-109) TaxID=649831 RepID=UPI0003295063|nr:exopolyphosphatase [Actinoplanes sp. N902-109]AGL17020.1 exopolyphosphatase [Actinoplanes sp. N902-109]
MRLAVLDVGANTLNLLVTSAGNAVPLPERAWKTGTRLAELSKRDGAIAPAGRQRLITAVTQAVAEARRAGVDEVFAYATAVVRDAPNRDRVLDEVADATGIRLGLLTGTEEAQLTFLAARRWLGWRAGSLLLADIGGGSLEVAVGPDRLPDVALSLPLGARALTRQYLGHHDPPPPRAVRALRHHVREQIGQVAARAEWEAARTPVATSKTFQQLARLTGAPSLRRGPFVTRLLRRRELRPWLGRLATMPVSHRAGLPGVSPHRARQILAGSIVAYELMRRLDLEALQICPWALREGIVLRRLEADQPATDNAAWVRLRPAAS